MSRRSLIFYGGIEVRFCSEIGVYIVHPNFHRWKILEVLPRTRYSREVL
jgi:hypothetical protein